MAVSNTLNARNAIANAVVALVDSGGTYAQGRIVIFDANNVILSTLLMSTPAFAAAVGGSCLANAIAADNAPVVGSLPARYECQDRNGAWVFRGSCGPNGDLGDNGQVTQNPMSVSNFSYVAPP